MWRSALFLTWVLLAAISIVPSADAADETSIVLADGPGLDRTQASCAMCHSLDYIQMNSPFLDRAGWERTVNKMIHVMGAPISAEDTLAIIGYLAAHYGKDSPPVTAP